MFAGSLGVAVLTLGLSGCGGGETGGVVEPTDVAPDGRPVGFEDMMKGMDANMKTAAKNPNALQKKADAAPK
jgi:hypothetical protein